MSRKEDLDKIKAMIEEVASSMYLKMETKYDEGQEGYDDPEMFTNLGFGFKEHLYKFYDNQQDPENILDMMNFLAMIRRQLLVKRDKLPDHVEIVTDPSEIHDFDEKEKKRIEEETDNEETRSIPAVVDMDRPEEEVERDLIEAGITEDKTEDTKEIVSPKEEEALADAGLKDPRRIVKLVYEAEDESRAMEDMKDAGLRGSEAGMKFRYAQDKESFDITPLAKDGETRATFCPIKSYAYIDKRKGIHHIRIAEIDKEEFMFQILSIEYDNHFHRLFKGNSSELLIFIEDEIIKHFKLK